MKKSSPISLFSFQDIITCLTGIMIVVVLVILLQLVEATAAVASRSQLQPEYLALKKRMEELIAERDGQKRKLADERQEKDEYLERSLPELKSMVKDELKYTVILERKVAEAEKAVSSLLLEVEKNKLRIERTRQELRTLARAENEVLELQAQLLALQERQTEVTEQIERKRRRLRFEFTGFDDRIPLLIECNSWGFRVKRYPDGEIAVFGNPKEGRAGKRVPDLEAWLRKQDLSSCYPVLLFRENALPIYDKVMEALYRLDSGIAIGKEPIGAGEECF